MDSISNVDYTEPLEARSEGLTASLGDKRAAENDELEVRPLKKARNDREVAGDLKRVAEIVLVLATMAKMRGGRSPTPAEIEMMAEARSKLAAVCQGFAPKDVFPVDAFGEVIENLGLNKVREQSSGFRPPNISIAEKLKLTKLKMEKSAEFTLHSATSSQRLQTNVGSAAENRGTPHSVRIISSEKPSQAPTSSSGSFQRASPFIGHHVPSPNSTPLPYQLPTSEIRPVGSSAFPSSSHLGRDSSSLALPRADRPHTRFTASPPAKTASDNKVPAHHASVKFERAADMSRAVPQAPTSKPFISQTTSVNLPQQLGKIVQAPPPSNTHNQIGKIVQKLLQPHLPEQVIWTPPSRDYMNKALTCQICQLIVNEVDTVLVCDACEKAYHLNCLQIHQKSVPRGEWHCGKCVSLSNGKPLPPKYGRVMRNMTSAPKVSSDKKVDSLDGKVNLQRVTANGNSGTQNAPHFAAGVEMVDARLMQRSDTLPSQDNKVNEQPSGSGLNNLMEASRVARFTPVDLSVERSREEKKLIAESKAQLPANPETVINTLNDQKGTPKISENPSKQCPDNTNLNIKELEKSFGEEILEFSATNGVTKEGVSLANHVGAPGTSIGPEEHGGPSSNCLRKVDWIGDVLKVVDEKTYYQACSVNGVVYKVHDHVLFRSSKNILTPSKLQGMWEDSKTRSKWVVASRCYFPADLPEAVGRPYAPEINEVYDSNHDVTVRADLIEGPCQVLPQRPFDAETQRRARLGIDESGGLKPLYNCKWFFDEAKGIFRAVTS